MKVIQKKCTIPVSSKRAFDKFVNEINEWWPAEYTWSQQKLQQITIDARVNGLCTETGPYHFRCDWGRVTEFEEGKKISFKWQISPQRVPEPDPEKASDVIIRFISKKENETFLDFLHANFENHGEGAAAYQQALDTKQGWDYILSRYIEYCKST